jgi:hypothetical protein
MARARAFTVFLLVLVAGEALAADGGDAALEDRVRLLEAQLGEMREDLKEASEEPGFLSALEERLSFGGEFRIQLVDSQNEPGPPSSTEAEPHLRIDRVRLEPRVQFTGKSSPLDIFAQGQFDFVSDEGGSTKVKELYAVFSGRHAEWAGSELKIGLEDRFIRATADTTFWPLPASAFWRQEELGLFLETDLGDRRGPLGRLRLNCSLSNGQALDAQEAGEDSDAFPVISQEPRLGTENAALREYGFGLGWNYRWLEETPVPLVRSVDTDIMGFYFNDSLTDADLGFYRDNLQDVDSSLIWADRAALEVVDVRGKELYGANAEVDLGDLVVAGQWIEGRDGKVRRRGGYVEATYGIELATPLVMEAFIREVTPLVRYEWLSTNLPRTPSNTLTWDRRRWALGLIVEVRKNVNLKTIYAFNEERTGDGDPDTNELVVQLELMF